MSLYQEYIEVNNKRQALLSIESGIRQQINLAADKYDASIKTHVNQLKKDIMTMQEPLNFNFGGEVPVQGEIRQLVVTLANNSDNLNIMQA